ncbi:type I 3-dehydroquinate dehydratase [Escherichia coli]
MVKTDFDILEWRVDHFADLSNVESVMAAAKISETVQKPLLFPFRSAKEGGEQAISTEAYIALDRAAIDSGLVHIDLELFTGDDQVKETVAYAHAHDVKVVMSNHDFHKRRKPKKSFRQYHRKCSPSTPIFLKIALMPQSTSDVLTLLTATLGDAGAVCRSSDHCHDVDGKNWRNFSSGW